MPLRRKSNRERLGTHEKKSACIPAADSQDSRGREAPSAAPEGQGENSPRAKGRLPPWVTAIPTPTPLCWVCRAAVLAARQTKQRGKYSFLLRYPGRRFACPGLLSYRPSGSSVWLATLASCRTQSCPITRSGPVTAELESERDRTPRHSVERRFRAILTNCKSALQRVRRRTS